MYYRNWQAVSGPTVPQGDFIGNAIKMATEATGGWQKAQQDNAAGFMAQEAAKYQDPAELQKALASGAITQGVDPRYITPALMKQMDERVAAGQEAQFLNKGLDLRNTEIQSAANRLAHEQQVYADQQRTVQENRALMPLEFDLAQLAQGGSSDDIKAYVDQNKSAFSVAGNKAASLIEGTLSKVYSREVGTTFDQILKAPNLSDRISLADTFLQNTTDESKRKLIRGAMDAAGLNKDKVEVVDALIAENAARTVPAGDSLTTGEGLVGPKGSDANPLSSYNTIVGDHEPGKGKYRSIFAGRNLTEHNLDELVQKGNQLREATRGDASLGLDKLPKTKDGRFQGTSAVGAYQILTSNVEKLAPEMFGPDWKSMRFTPEVQEKIAERLFNDRKKAGGDLRQEWVGLAKFGDKYAPKNMANVQWSDIRKDILSKESRFDEAAANYGKALTGQPTLKDPAYTLAESAKPQEATKNYGTGPLAVGKLLYEKASGKVDTLVNGAKPANAPAAKQVEQGLSGKTVTDVFGNTGQTTWEPKTGLIANMDIASQLGNLDRSEAMTVSRVAAGNKIGDNVEAAIENINRALPGKAKIGYKDFQTLYQNHTSKLGEGNRPSVGQFSEMLKLSTTGATTLKGKSMLADGNWILPDSGDVSYVPDRLDLLVKVFNPTVLREASTLTKDSKENVAAAEKTNAEVETLMKALKTERERAKINPRFNENVYKTEQLLRQALAKQEKYSTTN